MALHEWWGDDPAERYWVEITDREDLGANLHAPQLDDGGNEQWSYNLVTSVREGDIVFHWWKRGSTPAFVGWSRAVGLVSESTIIWTSHGTYGRNRGTGLPSPVGRSA